MLALHDPFPLLDEFIMWQNPYVLPLSLQEYWDHFYANGADNFYNFTLIDKGERPYDETQWFEPEIDHYKQWFNKEVKLQRNLSLEFDLPPNPIVKHVSTTKHYMLVSHTDTLLEIGVIDNQSGFPYASSFELYELWEIRSPYARSNQISIRWSNKIFWLDKPWVIDKLITKMLHDKTTEALTFQKGWAEKKCA